MQTCSAAMIFLGTNYRVGVSFKFRISPYRISPSFLPSIHSGEMAIIERYYDAVHMFTKKRKNLFMCHLFPVSKSDFQLQNCSHYSS